MIIQKPGIGAETPASPEYFTGKVRIQPLIEASAPSRMRSFIVDFAPARALAGIPIRQARCCMCCPAMVLCRYGMVR